MKKSRFFSLTIILGMIVFSILLVFRNNDLASVLQTLSSLNPKWLLGALTCWFASAAFDALVFVNFFRKHGQNITFFRALYVSMTGAFYSAITPGASGGQPMQVYELSKQGIPVGTSSSAISIRFVLSQLSIVVLTLLIGLLNQDLIHVQLSSVRWLIVIGWFVHLVGVILIILATFCKEPMQKILNGIVSIGKQLRLIRNPASVSSRLHGWLNSYHQSVLSSCSHPGELLLPAILTTISHMLSMMIPVCIYHAFGLQGACWQDLLFIAYMLYLSASYNPLPGASGAQEGGFLVFYQGIFPGEQISLAMLAWRFFSFYLYLLTGLVMLLGKTLRSIKRIKKETQ